MKRKLLVSILSLPAAVLALSLSACTDEKIVYQEVERKLWEEPPAGAVGFLGYAKAEEKVTICGNCHVGQQSTWVSTAHADAWVSLEGSGHAAATCEGCHAVSQLGNPSAIDGGWTTTSDERYYDVQCESCHGPGQMHVNNPGASQPLAPIDVGVDLTTGCGECHNGTHHPFVEQWENSLHATAAADGHGASCDPCHNAAGAFAAFNVKNEYLEKASGDATHMGIVCAVCHDPHANDNEGQLRFPIDEPSEEGNLCMKCHHKRGTPDPTTFRGPHAPEGPLLLGVGGWWPPNMEGIGNINGTHGSEANPKLCAGCHMQTYTVNNPDGSFLMNAVGHDFQATPCVDANGAPVDGPCELANKKFDGCATGGCHGSATAARSAYIVAEQRLHFLAEQLNAILNQVQPNWATCQAASNCPEGSPFKNGDGVYTTAEGSAFNYQMGLTTGAAAHNPFLVEALLTASIRQMQTDYPVTVPAGVVLDNILAK